MDLEFSDHARERMRRRQIPEETVYQIVGGADKILERDDGRTEYSGVWEERRLLVVTEGDEEPFRVVTVVEVGRRRGR